MYKQIKKLADDALALQNKDRMDAVLREISALCEFCDRRMAETALFEIAGRVDFGDADIRSLPPAPFPLKTPYAASGVDLTESNIEAMLSEIKASGETISCSPTHAIVQVADYAASMPIPYSVDPELASAVNAQADRVKAKKAAKK